MLVALQSLLECSIFTTIHSGFCNTFYISTWIYSLHRILFSYGDHFSHSRIQLNEKWREKRKETNGQKGINERNEEKKLESKARS